MPPWTGSPGSRALGLGRILLRATTLVQCNPHPPLPPSLPFSVPFPAPHSVAHRLAALSGLFTLPQPAEQKLKVVQASLEEQAQKIEAPAALSALRSESPLCPPRELVCSPGPRLSCPPRNLARWPCHKMLPAIAPRWRHLFREGRPLHARPARPAALATDRAECQAPRGPATRRACCNYIEGAKLHVWPEISVLPRQVVCASYLSHIGQGEIDQSRCALTPPPASAPLLYTTLLSARRPSPSSWAAGSPG